jgi:ribosome-associated protein
MKVNSISICKKVENILSQHKGLDIIKIDLKNKSSIADFMIVCSGTSSRHVISLSNYLLTTLKKIDLKTLNVEGKTNGDWVLVDAGDVIIHLFKSEVRDYYGLEKMWEEIHINKIYKE